MWAVRGVQQQGRGPLTRSGNPIVYVQKAMMANGSSVRCVPPSLSHASNTTSRYCLPSGGSVGAQLKTSRMVLEMYRYR